MRPKQRQQTVGVIAVAPVCQTEDVDYLVIDYHCVVAQKRLHPETGAAAGALAGGGAACRPAALPGGGSGQALAPVQTQPEEAAEVPVRHTEPPAHRRAEPLQPAAAAALAARPPGSDKVTVCSGVTLGILLENKDIKILNVKCSEIKELTENKVKVTLSLTITNVMFELLTFS